MQKYILPILMIIYVLIEQTKLVGYKGKFHFLIVFIIMLIFDFFFWVGLNDLIEILGGKL